MEEVDKIILHTLRQIGCDIDDTVTSLKQFDSDMIVDSAVRCLELIQPDIHLPHSLPPNMAAKYRVGQEIAQACMDQGFPGDIGYQTFLYSGESDIRRILMFLAEKLPKEEEKFLREPSESELLMRRIKCKVKSELSRVWLPPDVVPDRTSALFETCTDPSLAPAQAWRRFWRDDLPLGAIDNTHLLPTVVTLHSRGVLARYEPMWFVQKKPTSAGYTGAVPKFSTDSITAKRKPPLAPKPKPRGGEKVEDTRLKEDDEEEIRREGVAVEVEALIDSIDKLKLKNQQLKSEVAGEERSLAEERGKNEMKTRILELLPDAETNLQQLGDSVEAMTGKMVGLAQQWEKHRLPLVAEYRQLVSLHSSKQNESVQKAETARTLSERRHELETELKHKEQLLDQLQTESERVGKEANRSAYTRRILEIIGNVDKQKVEISKVLRDTQDVQKEINTLQGQLGRSFTLADEVIFADAKRDETSRKAYKLLATLHSTCDHIVAMVRETGATLRETRDLEDQIEKERSKDVAGNLERITADLNQMKAESAQLSAQLKLKQRSARPS